MKKSEKGFGLVEVVILIVVLVIIAATIWAYIKSSTNEAEKTNNTTTAEKTDSTNSHKDTEQIKLETQTIDNEGLVFDYDPKISAVKNVESANQYPSNLYVVETEVVTGDVTLSITTGIDGIGGRQPECTVNEQGECNVVDTKNSTYLGNPVTYRLVQFKQMSSCGHPGAPSCSDAPVTSSYLIDTSKDPKKTGPCCGVIKSAAKNTGKKAETAGSVLINIIPSKSITNPSLFKNKDFLETVKIVESLRYKK